MVLGRFVGAEDTLMSERPSSKITPGGGSISRLIPDLRQGDRPAIRTLWEHFFRPLAAVARRRMGPSRRRELGSEDLALEAFLDVCDCLARPDSADRFPRLRSRQELWGLLVCFTVRHAFDYNRKQSRRERVVRGESALSGAAVDSFAGREPAPEFEAAVSELLDALPDDTLRRVAVRKMEGSTVPEIAAELDCSASTVERKLRAIRAIWKSKRGAAP